MEDLTMENIHEYPFWEVSITDSFWDKWVEANLNALYYQWKQLENTRCIDNFRIVAGLKEGFREGWFFSDSDAYKWLDATARFYKVHPYSKLLELMNEFIHLIRQVQSEEGYINTYNQIFFPNKKWTNLWIGHELYCLGHLIEAIISVYRAFHDNSTLLMATKAADLVVRDFTDKDGSYVPGHQEIEIALIKLFEITQNTSYLKMAQQFLTRRGNVSGIFFKYLKQIASVRKKSKHVKKLKTQYFKDHPNYSKIQLPPRVQTHNPSFMTLRRLINTLSGKGHQHHDLLQNQLIPEGHSVRYTYTHIAMVHLHRLSANKPLLNASISSWDYMVRKRTFPTGGLGSLPMIEGFGRDYELNGEFAYCETCAGIGSLLWNWQLNLATKDPKYADFFEWQLYNAVLVGMGISGTTYLYRNPLMSKSVLKRESWFEVPCCPSNLSRTLASLGSNILFSDQQSVYINQYIGCSVDTPNAKFSMKSSLPFDGHIKISIKPKISQFVLNLRIPSWVSNPNIHINKEKLEIPLHYFNGQPTASGYSPYRSYYLPITHSWKSGDVVDIYLPMEIIILKYHKKVKNYSQCGTLTRGPLVYCLEDLDNPEINVFECVIDSSHGFHIEETMNEHPNIVLIKGMTTKGLEITAVPYYFWGNRGRSKMNTVLKFK